MQACRSIPRRSTVASAPTASIAPLDAWKAERAEARSRPRKRPARCRPDLFLRVHPASGEASRVNIGSEIFNARPASLYTGLLLSLEAERSQSRGFFLTLSAHGLDIFARDSVCAVILILTSFFLYLKHANKAPMFLTRYRRLFYENKRLVDILDLSIGLRRRAGIYRRQHLPSVRRKP